LNEFLHRRRHLQAILAGFLLFGDQLRNGSRRLGAALDPSFGFFLVDLKCSPARSGIIGADLLNVPTVTGKTLITDDDPVKGLLLRPMSAQTNSYTHRFFFSFSGTGWPFG
jgi:hypothetical protein